MMVFLISGNCKGVVEVLLRMLEKKEGGEDEVGQSLMLLMCGLMEKKTATLTICDTRMKSGVSLGSTKWE